MPALLLTIFFVIHSIAVFSQPDSSALSKAIALYNKGEYETSLPVFEQCLATAQSTNNKSTQITLLDYIGHIYAQTGKVNTALAFYHQSMVLAEETADNSASARALINIGALYEEQKDYVKALDNYNKAEAIAVMIKDSSVIADCANNKGVIYEQYLKKYPEAIREYNKALDIYARLKDQPHLGISYNNLGIVYKYQGNYPKAIEYYKKSLAIGKTTGNQFLIAANMTNIGNVYAMQQDFTKAIEYTRKGLDIALRINALNVVVEAAGSIAEDYAGLKNYEKAFEWQVRFSEYSDSLFNSERSKQIGELESKYQAAKNEKEITQLKEQQLTNQLNLSSQKILLQKRNYQFAGIGGLVLLLGIVGFLLYNRQQLKQKQQREKAVFETEYKERKRISREMHDDIGAGLTQITLISEHAKLHNEPTHANDLSAIAATSRKLISNMSEIVWSLNPENKTLDQLLSYLREQLNNLLEYSSIQYNIQFPGMALPIALSNEQKRNIILATKEIVHNAVKYSKAKNITVTASIQPTLLQFEIADDGCGFDVSGSFSGNGLRNIQQRINEIGGTLTITSGNGQGSRFVYSLPIAT
jgi:signal transduction histidine kinase